MEGGREEEKKRGHVIWRKIRLDVESQLFTLAMEANANVHCYLIYGRFILYIVKIYFKSRELLSNDFTGGPLRDFNELKFCICYNIYVYTFMY